MIRFLTVQMHFGVFLALVIVGACNRSTQRIDLVIVGFTATEPNLSNSSFLKAVYKDLGYKTVPGVKVWIAFDKDGNEPIKGYETESDANGDYRIDTNDIPASKDENGYYYLCVHKPGYDRFVQKILIGPFSNYMRNTFLIKSLGEDPDKEDKK